MADHRNQPKGCGKCQACKSVDCGSCSQCLSKKKFGGDIEDTNIICDRRQCENSDIQMISQDESSNYNEKNAKTSFSENDVLEVKNMTTYFERVEINKETYQIGDFAEVIPEDSNSKPYICKIIALFQIKQKSSVIKAAHVRWFARGENTIFGDIADPKEVFAIHDCEDVQLHRFMRLIQIQYQGIPENWSQLGGTSDSIVTPTTHIGGIDGIYWYRKLYHPDTARYEEVPPMLLHDDDGKACFTCSHLENKRRSQIPILEEDFETDSNTLLFKDQVFRIGSGVMVLPNTFEISIRQKKEFRKMRELEKKDPKVYTEYWRKGKRNAFEMNHPFDIGIIQKVFKAKHSEKIMVQVRVMMRPENVGKLNTLNTLINKKRKFGISDWLS